MKTKKWIAGVVLCAGFALAACTSDEGLNAPAETEQGQLVLNLSSGTNFSEETRAVNEDSYKNLSNYNVVVTDKDGIEKLSCKGSELEHNMPLTLTIGSYSVKAYYGKEHNASRDEFYVEGTAGGTVKSGNKNEPVTVICTPTCGRVKVAFADAMETYFSDYKVEFGGTKALGGQTFLWEKGDTDPWYIKLDEHGENISFTITATAKTDYESQETWKGSFPLQRNKAYKMTVKPGYVAPDTGIIDLEITIDESTNDIEKDIEVPVTWI